MSDLQTRMTAEMEAAQTLKQNAAMSGNPAAVLAADDWIQVIRTATTQLGAMEGNLLECKRLAIEAGAYSKQGHHSAGKYAFSAEED